MKDFFGEDALLGSKAAQELYRKVKDLPIIDYHCHLDARMIKNDATFSDIGELWLKGDHYKWCAMRQCGVDEEFITGGASWHDKFLQYAKIVPALAGNPLYYWTHMELKRIFKITLPLNADTAEKIYRAANAKLKTLSVQKILKDFGVKFIATTDDPADDLSAHGKYGDTLVAPTFRPDKLFSLDGDYLTRLEGAANMKINALDDLLTVLKKRLDFFVSKGCRIADHAFEFFPRRYASQAEAARIFAARKTASGEEKDAFFGFLIVWLAREYARRKIAMQLHFGAMRNVNPTMHARCGVDSGFDILSEPPAVESVVRFLQQIPDDERPDTLLYCLNDATLSSLAAITGAFRRVRMGAAWWFNDTVEGIRRNLSVISEYSVLGTYLGMLTDSRSFSSYCRFDFFRRILCDYIGALVEKGEYDGAAAEQFVENICYCNAKELVKL